MKVERLCAIAAMVGTIATLAAVPKTPAKPKHPIAIVLNGDRLDVDASPLVYKYHLMVPVRRIIEALGLDFSHVASRVTTHVGSKTIVLRIGSATALVDGQPVELDTPPVELKYVLYAPLRFFTDVLGAQVAYDKLTRSVNIVAQLVGRSGDGLSVHGNVVDQQGTATAIDLDSDPPTITLTYNASVRTVNVEPNAIVDLQDVNATVTVPGELADVRPGDFVHLVGDKAGIKHVIDEFGSRVGTVAAVADGEFVLDDGHVIVPDRTTQVSIDGTAASVSDLRAGDAVTVRYNVESNEPRSVLVSRPVVAGTPAPAGSVAIVSVQPDTTRPLRAGDRLGVTVRGTPGGAATFDVGPYVSGISTVEHQPGVYTGYYDIPSGANFAGVPVIAHLHADGQEAPAVGSTVTISASSSPPGVTDFAPDNAVTVNNARPAIYATFTSDAVAVDPSSLQMWVNGHNVTSVTVRSPRFIEYVPGVSYPDGQVHVTVRVADLAGNVTTKTWSFNIRTH